MREEVLRFISRFATEQAVIDVFTQGCCYWFAEILRVRFRGDIVYDTVENHFACMIGDAAFDITGDVTDGHNWRPWLEVLWEDRARGDRIYRDCIL